LLGFGGVSSATLGAYIGAIGGAETHTLSTAELAAHTHSVHATAAVLTGAGGSDGPVGTTVTGSTGGGGAHNNLQPSAVLNKIIKT
jgi:microcystin-dependent protein